MPPSRSWFPNSGRGSQWRPRALDCDGRRERSVRVGRSGAAGAPNGDVHGVGARRCLDQLQIEMYAFPCCFSKNLTSKFVLRRVDAIRRVVTQKMSNAPLGGRQSGGTGGGQFSNRGPRRNSNGRIVEKRSHCVPCWMRQTRAWKTPASAVIIIWRDELRSRPFSDWAESRVGGSVGSRGATPHAV